MIYNITSKQKAVTRDIVNAVNNNQLEETFFVIWGTGLEGPRLRLGETMRMNKDGPIIVNTDGSWFRTSVDPGILDALGAEGLLRLMEDESYPFALGVSQMGPPTVQSGVPSPRNYSTLSPRTLPLQIHLLFAI